MIHDFFCLGIDHLLAQHIAHLFIRDPISLFSEKINQDDANDTDHFEVMHLLSYPNIKVSTLTLKVLNF